MNRIRSSKGTLFPPQFEPTHSADAREKWLKKARAEFVQPSKANHAYYSIILELLWPENHGLPGPHVSEEAVRAALDAHRLSEGSATYKDPFRRMRELQGDEGFKSIIKSGKTYQLQSTQISPKREPRSKPAASLWRKIRSDTDATCAKCGQREPDIKLSPDHRIPRSRGGGGDDLNWQPLCHQCNILKSAACQNCERVCGVCFWAYPEKFSELDISDTYRQQIRELAENIKKPQNSILNDILRDYFSKI